jgi:hypothetical protein
VTGPSLTSSELHPGSEEARLDAVGGTARDPELLRHFRDGEELAGSFICLLHRQDSTIRVGGHRRHKWQRQAGKALALVGVRADQSDDKEERDGNQEVDSAARDEAHNLRRRRRGPDFLHEPECVGPS